MIRSRPHTLRAGVLCLVVLAAPAACRPGVGTVSTNEILHAAEPDGPIVARIGAREIHADEIGPLAAVALELRRELGLSANAPTSAGEALALALEPVVLAATGADLVDDPAVREQARRLLARLFLTRVIEPRADRPATPEDLAGVLDAEIRRYAASASSDFFEPSLVCAAVLFVGLRPDLLAPSGKRAARLTPEDARAVAEDFRRRCGERVLDLDRFLSLARAAASDHPTVRLEEFPLIGVDPLLAGKLHPELHRVLVGLDGNGAVSPVVAFEGGCAVIRRGAFRAGHHETVETAREHLLQKLRHQRRAAALRQALDELRAARGVATYPERLPKGEASP